MRRAIAYSAFDAIIEDDKPRPHYPMDVPTRQFANHFGDQALIGIVTKGSLAYDAPINRPYAGQGAEVVAFPLLQPSRVAPNFTRVNMMTAQNFFSPSRHPSQAVRLALSAVIPPRAVVPTKDIKMPPKYGMRGTGGHYIHPMPQANASPWPTSSEWLAGRVRGIK